MRLKGITLRIKKLHKVGVIFLFVAVFVLLLQSMDPLEFNHSEANNLKKNIYQKKVSNNFCTFKPRSPADAEETRLIMDSISWPDTSSLADPLLLNQTSDPVYSMFTILPRRGGGKWQVGDQLEVLIEMNDFYGQAKESGGDFIVARLHNRELEAGVAGQVVDHLDGSYSAFFPLLWEGSAQVEVTFVHSREAIRVLCRLSRVHPDRITFRSHFRSGSIIELATCNVCLRETSQPQCNYTDLYTGEPWFCYKPKKLSCDARTNHMLTGYTSVLTANEKMLFQRGVNSKVLIRASGPAGIKVLPRKKGQHSVNKENFTMKFSGFYYKGVWQSFTKVHHFNTPSDISQCLKAKMVYMYGDSTVRQWFEYLNTSLPDVQEVNLNSPRRVGPFMLWDSTNKFMVRFRIHGLPLLTAFIPTSRESYIAKELDTLVGGANTVVVLGICSHFASFPLELYIRRLQGIRRAVVRLLSRAPNTLVVIKTGTLTSMHPHHVETNVSWFSAQMCEVLRTMFKGLNVKLVDAWDMVLAHHLPHDIHPGRPIIRNMVNVLLSYICPQKTT